MYNNAFPKCEVQGSFVPIEFDHGALEGAIPEKCASCKESFEGSCLRAITLMDDYLSLDHGPCEIAGDTTPTKIDSNNNAPIYVPKKCSQCDFLKQSDIDGYYCSSEREKWGDFHRSLDWGNWEPDHPVVGIRRINNNIDEGPATITKELIALILENKTTKALKLYRSINAIDTIKEASDAVKLLQSKLKTLITI